MLLQTSLLDCGGRFAAFFAGGAFAEPGITADTIIIGQAAGFTGSVAGTVRS